MNMKKAMLGRLFAVIVISQASAVAFAQDACQVEAGRIASVEGQVQLQSNGQESWHQAKINESVCQGDTIRVGERSRAAIALANQAVMRLDQSTTMRLTNISGKPEKRSFIDLVKGSIESFIRHPHLLTVNTPYLNGSIEGTEFMVSAAEDHGSLLVLEGKVKVSNDKGSVSVTSGQMAEAKPGEAPVMHVVVRPEDAVQWTLYYPPILNSLAGNGDTTAAFAELDKVPQDQQDANYHIRKAALLLKVGQQSEASAELDAALKLDPNNGTAYALQAIIHVVHNERDKALAEAQKAVSLGDTVAARIALSYAQQSTFHIEAARDTMLAAVKQHPEDAEAWARLSELQLMLGDRSRARDSAEKAAKLAPGLARTQNVLGFAALAEVKTKPAAAAFEKAIAADSASPLSHLGLGLAEIRQGHLAEGRGELELAVALDSNNSLLRAYLGKAYFEEKRGPLDAQQFQIAEQLDPLDPTAYLYDAIRLQSENRPVEAFHAIQDSIARNDNRAVYRSRLLLDSDQAARSASLARVYNDLGFQDLALSEGWKSVNLDPSDYSAHRFLADSYSVLPRHEIARVSELLQSQLLQPLNLLPIQPTDSISNLNLMNAGGPSTAGANEFNSLFNRNQNNMFVDLMRGEQDSYNGNVVLSGIHNHVSYSIGATNFGTDGFRPNSYQKDKIADLFVQAEISPFTSLQFEYRYRYEKYGELNQNFFTPPSPSLSNVATTNNYRVGLRQAFSPGSILLGSVMYQDLNTLATDSNPGFPFTLFQGGEPHDHSLGTELQYLYRSPKVNVTSGVGYFDLSRSQAGALYGGAPFYACPDPPFTDNMCFSFNNDQSAKHTNAYSYANINALPNLILTVGLSYDSFDPANSATALESKHQVNPKLGVTWNVLPNTTLRAAAFKVFTRTMISSQTLEPTQVAGFNQFYDDFEMSSSKHYGIAVDQKFTGQLFGGAEYSQRDLTVPYQVNSVFVDKQWDEHVGRAYLFYAPADRWALSAEYRYELMSRPDSATYTLDEHTHKVPLGVRYFDPSGWSAAITETYVNQNGQFYDPNGAPGATLPGSSKFWLTDASVSYRLPKRQGVLMIGATNLFNKKFTYQETDFNNPTVIPTQMIYARFSFTLP
jgi:tetratricopeptide (TPR) repeat protein/opacity protein-like surface antigen